MKNLISWNEAKCDRQRGGMILGLTQRTLRARTESDLDAVLAESITRGIPWTQKLNANWWNQSSLIQKGQI